MEVIINCNGGFKPFLLEVGYFDSVGKIKEKIEKQEGIPISRQTIWFNDEILPDDFNVRDSRIVDGSTVLLLISADQEINNQFHQPLPANDLDQHFLNNVDLNLSLLNQLLKSPSCVSNSDILDRYPISNLQPLQEGILHDINAPLAFDIRNIRTDPNENLVSDDEGTQGNRGTPESLIVIVRRGRDLSFMRVGRDEAVSVLRRRLQQAGMGVPEQCFFVHRRRVMEEDQSFERNDVRRGDFIDVFDANAINGVAASASASR